MIALEHLNRLGWFGLLLVTLYEPVEAAKAEPARVRLQLTTGTDDDPFANPAAPHGGIATDVVQRVFARAGYETTIDWLPWKRGYALTLHGRYAATFPYVDTEARRKDYLFSAPLLSIEQRAYGMPGRGIENLTLATMPGKCICTPEGWATTQEVDRLVESGQLRREAPHDQAACLKMLSMGRADFMIMNQYRVSRMLEEAGLRPDQIAVSTTSVSHSYLYLMVPIERPGAHILVDEFNGAMATMRKLGELPAQP
ncbi:MAG: transporter substrate-binding domain-containing protein [Burkholderiales bacterium]|nr:transporter substrate-binding domain-containing protein [Burkholderiales bacterium]